MYTTKEDMDEVGLKLMKLIPDEKLYYKTDAATLRKLYKYMYMVPHARHTKPSFGMMENQFFVLHDKRYGKWIIQCTKHNVESMYQSIRKAAEEGVLGDVLGVKVYRDRDVANISVFTTEEDIEKVGYNVIEW